MARFCFVLILVLAAAGTAACRDSVTTPSSAAAHASAEDSPSPLASTVAGLIGRFIETPLGAQPAVTPSLRIEAPSATGRIPANAPITIRVRYQNFDYRPELRTGNADATLGSQSQVLTDGFVQGHAHGYLQRIPEDGSMPDVQASSFCVLVRAVEKSGYDGVAEGDCPGVPPGEYRLSAEFQTNSHTAILKNGARAAPTADALIVRVR